MKHYKIWTGRTVMELQVKVEHELNSWLVTKVKDANGNETGTFETPWKLVGGPFTWPDGGISQALTNDHE